jgi:hypothetical protein
MSLTCALHVNLHIFTNMRPRWGSNPGLTDRLIVGRNVTLTLATDPEVRLPALPDFLRSSGSGTAFTQPREDT